MILEIVNDMKNFMIVLFIGIIGFTGGFYILQKGLGFTENDKGEKELVRFAGETPFKAFIYTYRMVLGDFQLDNFNDYEENLPIEYYLIWIIFIVGSLFLVIVLLNLLIAIMGDTFGRTLELIPQLIIREKVMLISENEALIDRETKFKQSQYLIIIKEKVMEVGAEDTLENKMEVLKGELKEKVTGLQEDVIAQIEESNRDMKKRFLNQEEKAIAMSKATDQKMTVLQSEFDKGIKQMNEAAIVQQV